MAPSTDSGGGVMSFSVMVTVVVAALACALQLFLSDYVTRIVPEPYMDEIFHYDQMRQYCNDNFTYWNPKISTPPGLCLALEWTQQANLAFFRIFWEILTPAAFTRTDWITYMFVRYVAFVLPLPDDDFCSLRSLRYINAGLYFFLCYGAICFYLFEERRKNFSSNLPDVVTLE